MVRLKIGLCLVLILAALGLAPWRMLPIVPEAAAAEAVTGSDEAIYAAPVTVSVYAAVYQSIAQVSVYGTISSGEGSTVTVKVVNPAGDIGYINQTNSGASGDFRFTYGLAGKAGGTYQVWAGGAGVASPATTRFTYTTPAVPADESDDSGDSGGGGTGGGGTNSSSGSGGVDGAASNPDRSGGEIEVSGGGVISGTPSIDSATGQAHLQIGTGDLAAALDKAVPDMSGVKTVAVQVENVAGAHSYALQLPAGAISAATADVMYRIETSIGTISVPSDMLNSDTSQGADSLQLTIGAVDAAALDESVRRQIGDRPVIEIGLSIHGASVPWNNPDAPVTVSVPYRPSAEELQRPEHIVILYVDEAGKTVPVASGRYDAGTGAVTFTTSHFSTYAVAYVNKAFADLSHTAWAQHAIEVLAAKGIVNGTSDTTFSPGSSVTRADFLMLLVHTLGLDARVEDNFADVKQGAYYYEAVGIAKALGITQGVGDNRFGPDEPISRQDMMVQGVRALEKLGRLKVPASASGLEAFADRADIADYAAASIAALVKADFVLGADDGSIHPAGETTRAEAAVFLYRIYNH